MIANILAIEDPIFNWVFDHIPTIGAIFLSMFVASWLTWKIGETITHYRNRLNKVEYDSHELRTDTNILKNDVTILKQDVTVLKNDVIVLKNDVIVLKNDVKSVKRRVTRIEKKLDKLISYLTTTRQVDKDILM